MLRGIALDVRVARTKGYTFGDTLRNIYSGGDSPLKNHRSHHTYRPLQKVFQIFERGKTFLSENS